MTNHMHILVGTTHCGVHLNGTNSEGFLDLSQRPISIKETLELIFVRMETSFVILSSKFTGARLLPRGKLLILHFVPMHFRKTENQTVIPSVIAHRIF